MNEEALLQRITDLAGLDAHDASMAARATLGALGERIVYEERAALARELPDDLAALFRGRKYRGRFSVANFFDRVQKREKVSLGFAREHAQVVCRAIGELLSEDAFSSLERRLPEAYAELFRSSQAGEPPTDYRLAKGPNHHTLATGAPGSQHPLSESSPPAASANSVAGAKNPHGDAKLSSARGTTQERLDETLATAHPDDRRTIGKASD
ncbi:MAG: DUF2267 domain-containing protein [Polyangiaceae bacterium]